MSSRDTALETHDFAVLAETAARYARQGDYSDAAVLANEIILDLDAENVDTLLRLLRCRLQRSEYEEAIAVADRLAALPLETDDEAFVERWRTEAEAGLGRLQEKKRLEASQRREREKQLASVEEIDSPTQALHLGKAARSFDPELAIAYMRHGLFMARSRGDRLPLLAAIAPILRDNNRLDEALAEYQKAIELEPSYERNKAVYTSLTATLRRVGRIEEARAHGERLRKVHPADPYVLNALGAVYMALVQRDRKLHLAKKAEECFLRAAGNSPEPKNPVRYLRELAETVRQAGEGLEAMGMADARERAAADAQRLEGHIDRLLKAPRRRPRSAT